MEENNFINPAKHQELSHQDLSGAMFDGVKITNAVYRILDLLPDYDPLKNKAKEKALAILEQATVLFEPSDWVSLKDCLPAAREKTSAQLLDDIEILINYLKVGKGQGWIDSTNFLIITGEYGKIRHRVSMLRMSMPKTSSISGGIAILETKPIETFQKNRTGSIDPVMVKKNQEKPDESSAKLSERQSKILQILNKREKAQVADFIKELPKITKRTVRRDLDDLLKKGKIIRVGQWNQVFYQKMA